MGKVIVRVKMKQKVLQLNLLPLRLQCHLMTGMLQLLKRNWQTGQSWRVCCVNDCSTPAKFYWNINSSQICTRYFTDVHCLCVSVSAFMCLYASVTLCAILSMTVQYSEFSVLVYSKYLSLSWMITKCFRQQITLVVCGVLMICWRRIVFYMIGNAVLELHVFLLLYYCLA